MFRRAAFIFGLVVFAFFISGCATAKKQKQSDMEIQGLRNQISALESQVQSKDEEIGSLRDQLDKALQAKEESSAAAARVSKKKIGEVKSRPNVKQIQVALFNAGYNPGDMDGKMGKQTREAIKSFQKANGLTADGSVGKKTWKLLAPYLYKNIK